MRSYQFEVIDEVTREPLEEKTPVVTANTLSEAMNDPTIVNWCTERNARIFRIVG